MFFFALGMLIYVDFKTAPPPEKSGSDWGRQSVERDTSSAKPRDGQTGVHGLARLRRDCSKRFGRRPGAQVVCSSTGFGDGCLWTTICQTSKSNCLMFFVACVLVSMFNFLYMKGRYARKIDKLF